MVNRKCYQPKNIRQWKGDTTPLHREGQLQTPLCYPHDCEEYTYQNKSGHTIIRAFIWCEADGQLAHVYRTLQRGHRSTDSQWAEVLPQPPYPFYNESHLWRWFTRPVVLVENEAVAESLAKADPLRVYSTVPGDLTNLPYATLAPLRDRRVTVIMTPEIFPMGKLIRQALHDAGVSEAFFSLGPEGDDLAFDELERVASEHGCELHPAPAKGATADEPPIKIVRAGEPITREKETRPVLLAPIIREGYLVWMFGEPKIGKSWMGGSIAYAVAMGNKNLARWCSQEPCGVLLVDSESFPDELEQSIHMIMAGFGDPQSNPPFDILFARDQRGGSIDITDHAWQALIRKSLKGKKLLILDNIQSLTNNTVRVVDQLRPWFYELMQDGIAILVLDHTNRDGDLQGSIAKERIANLSMALRYPDKAATEDGRVLVEYSVARRLHGDDARPFVLQKVFTEDSFAFRILGNAQAPLPSLPEKDQEKVRRMAQIVFARDREKLAFPMIEKRYGVSRSTAHDRYEAAKKLVGTEKMAFDAELGRLVALQAEE